MSVVAMQILRRTVRTCSNVLTLRLCNRHDYSGSVRLCSQSLNFESSLKTSVHSFHKTPVLGDWSENAAMRVYFLDNIHYKNSIANCMMLYQNVGNEKAMEILQKDWSSADDKDILEAMRLLTFNILSKEPEIPSKYYANLLAAIKVQISQCNVVTLKNMLEKLVILHPRVVSCPEYKDIEKALDKYGPKVLSTSTSKNDLLLIGDCLQQIQMHNSVFASELIRKIGGKPHQLTAKQITQLCYLIIFLGNSKINMYEIEYEVAKNLDQLTLTELGIICMGFFRSRTKFRDPEFVQAILERSSEQMENLNSYTIAAILKMLRYSTPLEKKHSGVKFIERLTPKLSSFPLQLITHTAHMVTNWGIVHKNTYTIIIDQLKKNIQTARLKDIERILHSLSLMHECHKDNSVYIEAINEILNGYQTSRKWEIEKFNLCLARILTSLAYHNIYAPNLLECAMNKKAVNRILSKTPRFTPYDYWYLHHCVQLDYPEYSGPCLEQKMYDYALQKVTEDAGVNKTLTRLRGLTCDIAELCKDTFSASAVYVDNILPHYSTPTIVIAFGQDNNFLNAEEVLSAMPEFSFKRVNTEALKDTKWIAIVPFHSGNVRGEFLFGNMLACMRHLRLLGYFTTSMTLESFTNIKTSSDPQQALMTMINSLERPDVQEIMSSRQIIVK